MLDTGSLRTVVDTVLPLAQVRAAYSGDVRQRLGRGKLVIAVAALAGDVESK
jgi:NADPH:quinone reductase-like Zn-dependent oxidoreductase